MQMRYPIANSPAATTEWGDSAVSLSIKPMSHEATWTKCMLLASVFLCVSCPQKSACNLVASQEIDSILFHKTDYTVSNQWAEKSLHVISLFPENCAHKSGVRNGSRNGTSPLFRGLDIEKVLKLFHFQKGCLNNLSCDVSGLWVIQHFRLYVTLHNVVCMSVEREENVDICIKYFVIFAVLDHDDQV